MNRLEAFTCLQYAHKELATEVTELRYHLFYAKKYELERHQLPPCKDCFMNKQNMHSEPTTRLVYEDVWKRIDKCQVPLVEDRSWCQSKAQVRHPISH